MDIAEKKIALIGDWGNNCNLIQQLVWNSIYKANNDIIISLGDTIYFNKKIKKLIKQYIEFTINLNKSHSNNENFIELQQEFVDFKNKNLKELGLSEKEHKLVDILFNTEGSLDKVLRKLFRTHINESIQCVVNKNNVYKPYWIFVMGNHDTDSNFKKVKYFNHLCLYRNILIKEIVEKFMCVSPRGALNHIDNIRSPVDQGLEEDVDEEVDNSDSSKRYLELILKDGWYIDESLKRSNNIVFIILNTNVFELDNESKWGNWDVEHNNLNNANKLLLSDNIPDPGCTFERYLENKGQGLTQNNISYQHYVKLQKLLGNAYKIQGETNYSTFERTQLDRFLEKIYSDPKIQLIFEKVSTFLLNELTSCERSNVNVILLGHHPIVMLGHGLDKTKGKYKDNKVFGNIFMRYIYETIIRKGNHGNPFTCCKAYICGHEHNLQQGYDRRPFIKYPQEGEIIKQNHFQFIISGSGGGNALADIQNKNEDIYNYNKLNSNIPLNEVNLDVIEKAELKKRVITEIVNNQWFHMELEKKWGYYQLLVDKSGNIEFVIQTCQDCMDFIKSRPKINKNKKKNSKNKGSKNKKNKGSKNKKNKGSRNKKNRGS